jgi:TolB-like protein
MPFENLSGDREQEYFADGLVAEIITALNRIRWLFVIARGSSTTYKGQPLDPKKVGRELGVRYVLEGSIRNAGGRLRVTAHLINALTGALLWADRLDGWIEDALSLQDKVALSVAGGIEPVLEAAEVARSSASQIDDLGAYDLYLRARAILLSSARQIPEALHLTELAIARDPHCGPAFAWAAICCYRLILDGRSEHPALHRLKGTNFARRALEVAGDDTETRANAAAALSYFGEDIDVMTAAIHHAVKLNPSFARGWSLSAMRRVWAGQLDLAIEHAETALRLSPRARVGTPLLAIGAAHFLNRRFDEAVPKLLLAIQDDLGFPEPHRFLAACYAQMGRPHSAREIVARLRTISSPLITGANCLHHPGHRDLFFSGLRLAARRAPAEPTEKRS